MSATAKNLEAIQRAIIQHNGNCGAEITEIRMSAFEVERLGFEDFRGIPIVADKKLGAGRFRLVCEGIHDKPPQDATAHRSVGASADPIPA
jgi:hypothetical protein